MLRSLLGFFVIAECIYGAQRTYENQYFKPVEIIESAPCLSSQRSPILEPDEQELGFLLFSKLFISLNIEVMKIGCCCAAEQKCSI